MNEAEEFDQWLGVHVPERLAEEMVFLNRGVREQHFAKLNNLTGVIKCQSLSSALTVNLVPPNTRHDFRAIKSGADSVVHNILMYSSSNNDSSNSAWD